MSGKKLLECNFSDFSVFQRHYWLIAVGIAGTTLFAFRKWLSGGRCKSTARLDGKTVLITGGNTGIGKATALDLASRGANVIIACRDLGKGNNAAMEIRSKVPGAEVDVYHLNLASFHSIRQFSKEISSSRPFIHILINNAGIAFCPESRTEDGFELQFGVNHLGHFLLTNLLLKNIKSCVPARIINVSSSAHERGVIHFENINLENEYSPYSAYFQSKLANVLFSHELARRLHGSGISVYCVHPGVVRTELGRYLSIHWILGGILQVVSRLLFKTAEQGAQTSIYCAVDEDIQEQSGFYYSDCKRKNPAAHALDDNTALRLWEISEQLVGLQATK